jgi:hypothetical protein
VEGVTGAGEAVAELDRHRRDPQELADGVRLDLGQLGHAEGAYRAGGRSPGPGAGKDTDRP